MADKLQKKKKLNLNQVLVSCITCSTGFKIMTTLKKDFKIDVCSNCHSFYLGKQKFESKAGRMKRFRQMEAKTQKLQAKMNLVDNKSLSKTDQKVKKSKF